MTPAHWELALTGEAGQVAAAGAAIPVPVALCDAQGRIRAASGPLDGLVDRPSGGEPATLAACLAAVGVADAEARLMAARARPQLVVLRSGEITRPVRLLAQPASDGHWLVWLLPQEAPAPGAGDPSEVQSLIAHDLRSPLAVIQSYAGLLITGQPGPLTPTQREFLAGIDAKVAEVSCLLDDLLDLGRLDAGTLDLRPEPVAMQELLGRLEQDLGAALAGAGVDLAVAVAPEDLVVRADALRLRQVLETLLADGIAASEPGQQIAVAAVAADGELHLTVSDRGATFAAADRERLFTPYGGRRGSRSRAGTGLGLAVSARLVALHGGRLSVDAPAGGGTCFTVRLPAAVTTPDAR